MTTEWQWVMFVVMLSALIGYHIWPLVRPKKKLVEQANKALKKIPQTTPQKKDERRRSKFQGYEWKWPVQEVNSNNCDVPVTATSMEWIFLQEIRDNAERKSQAEQLLLKEIITELKSLNAYMHQLFGPDNDRNG